MGQANTSSGHCWSDPFREAGFFQALGLHRRLNLQQQESTPQGTMPNRIHRVTPRLRRTGERYRHSQCLLNSASVRNHRPGIKGPSRFMGGE